MSVEAIVVAGGSGSRMQSAVKKPYLQLGDVPIFIHTLRRIAECSLIDRIVLVVGEEDIEYARSLVSQYQISKTHTIIAGGKERQDSVRNGLAALGTGADIIVVHDGARPFVEAKDIRACIEAAQTFGAATLATPVKDTIKKILDGSVLETLDRQHLYAIQTPQAFRSDLLLHAHQKALTENLQGTDDASLVELLGYEVRMVAGSYRNIKITTPEDLLIARAFLEDLQ